jgi:hypothetical protein
MRAYIMGWKHDTVYTKNNVNNKILRSIYKKK